MLIEREPSETPVLAKRIMVGMAPAITTLLAAEIDKLRHSDEGIKHEERRIKAICKEVADAVDRLEGSMHTCEEIPARRALINAARRLRTAIRAKERNHAIR